MMIELKLDKNKSAAVIVAHPDDETIWMGGTIARNKDISWMVFVLCRESDPNRMPKFRKIMSDYYNVEGVICDLEDEGIMTVAESVPEIKSIIKKRLPNKKFDYIFTHGPKGDYGHPRHIGVHNAVRDMFSQEKANLKSIFYFAYQRKLNIRKAIPDKTADFYVELSKDEWKAKRDVIKNLYGFSKMSFENISCSAIETFNN